MTLKKMSEKRIASGREGSSAGDRRKVPFTTLIVHLNMVDCRSKFQKDSWLLKTGRSFFSATSTIKKNPEFSKDFSCLWNRAPVISIHLEVVRNSRTL